MRYGVSPTSITPMRSECSDASEMVSQLLYGETFKIIDTRKNWFLIRLHHDLYEGWVDKKMVLEIDEKDFQNLNNSSISYSEDILTPVAHSNESLSHISYGSRISSAVFLGDTFIHKSRNQSAFAKAGIVKDALCLLNAPYLWGGRTPFGIDCSGFTQLIYRMNGKEIKRDASQQAEAGDSLSFVEEAEEGDLAFFDNAEGIITHVGIIMANNYIIHAHGKVRVDRIDQTGIYNEQLNYHSHKLRVIKSL
ncbi:hydrolase Nlp/P60 [Nonlabens spongiae]|uniref:Hydrolase Nlp/P60 n=1 Tax=Nonlabens spongiae TaxID=331648 RepID=A0A1W6MG95_9FLAO|nr:C40 family peptidase [Nonlabens spongiae]ARN76628.1 hydrolase Nlp/P60 [Nonlabens spongiae]